MENIFENAYFGKAYKTKDGTRVTFIEQRYEDDFSIHIPKCKYSIETTHRYNSKGEFYLGNGEYGHGALDIISEWQEPVDEEKLDKLAEESEKEQISIAKQCESLGKCYGFDYITGFKAGYRKAKEE